MLLLGTMLSSCAAPGTEQSEAPCLALESAWNTYAVTPPPAKIQPVVDALDSFDYDSSTSTATDAARLAKQNLIEAVSGNSSKNVYFWNSLNLIANECSSIAAISFEKQGEPVQKS